MPGHIIIDVSHDSKPIGGYSLSVVDTKVNVAKHLGDVTFRGLQYYVAGSVLNGQAKVVPILKGVSGTIEVLLWPTFLSELN